MHLRHEWKHLILPIDKLALHTRLSAVMEPDPHAIHGLYLVRSLYFDNLYDTVLRDKIDGVDHREKFRLRLYNNDPSLILLEKKCKHNGLCSKEQERLTLEETAILTRGEYHSLATDEKPLLRELVGRMDTHGLRPRTLVDYKREPFIYAPGNVRVTLDYEIRTGLRCTDFLNPACTMIPVPDDPIILEVKWDAYLPGVIRDLVQTPTTRTSAFSKYAACRSYC